MKKAQALLHYADSEQDGDMYYLGRVFVPDPFVALVSEGRRYAVVSQLEYARVCSDGCFDEVIGMEAVLRAGRERFGSGVPVPVVVAAEVGRMLGVGGFEVGDKFPHGLAVALMGLGYTVEVREGALFPEREIKTAAEAEMIREGNAAAVAGFKVVEKVLRAAKVGRGGYLMEGKRRLTSERLQTLIAVACLERGAVAKGTIVAGGAQACDPHQRGHGPLRANELIIVDIFPRVSATGYHGDMTRTYLKGRASEAQRALVETVKAGHGMALEGHRARKSGAKLYRSVVEHFAAAGYKTERVDGRPVGFIHGLGHGLGLEVHEPPRVNPTGSVLRAGQVITVEPGLYYPEIGGARVEDVVWVRNGAPELLSEHGYRWEY